MTKEYNYTTSKKLKPPKEDKPKKKDKKDKKKNTLPGQAGEAEKSIRRRHELLKNL